MSDLTARLLLASGAVVLAAATTMLLRWRSARPVRTLSPGSLAPGTYLFSSSACLDCAPARKALIHRLGESGFTELKWEEMPGIFDELGIDAVPATMIVSPKGSARLWPGVPDENVFLP